MTSLASQLAGIKANNNATVLDKSRRRKLHSVSLLYDSKVAASQDFETIYYESVESFRELASIDSRFLVFENSLFSETSIRFDRLVQSRDQDEALNNGIEHFLMLISGYLHLSISFRVLEWLVRRFQIHVHNVESLLLSTLPWHDSEQFVRILNIIYHQNFPESFKFLLTCKQVGKGPSTSSLVRVLFKDNQLFEIVNQFEIKVINNGFTFDKQLMFWSEINSLIIMVHKEQGTLTECADQMLPVISEGLESPAQLATYIIFSVLLTQVQVNDDILAAAQDTIVANWTDESKKQGLTVICQIHEYRTISISSNIFEKLIESFNGITGLVDTLLEISASHEVSAFASEVINRGLSVNSIIALAPLFKFDVSDTVLDSLIQLILKESPFDHESNAVLVDIVEQLESKISNFRMDKIELALQTHIARKTSSSIIEAELPVEKSIEDVSSDVGSKQLIDEANALPVATYSFLQNLLSHDDKRAQTWVKASALGLNLDNLRQLMRVAPEHELSFSLAIAIGPWPTVSRCTAARFARATISSLVDPQQGGDPTSVDFQAVLGPVLFLLSDPERRVRAEGVQLLDVLTLNSASGKPKYEKELNLNWLSKTDYHSIITKLKANSEECVLDREYIFTAVRNAGKASLCDFLASYSTCILPPVLWVCLRCLASFKGVAIKLTPLISSWNYDTTRSLWNERCTAFKFPVSGLEKALVGAINSNDEVGVNFLLEMLKTREEPLLSTISAHVVQLWSSVFRQDTRIKVANSLIDMAIDEKVAFDSTEILNILAPLDTEIFASLLTQNSQGTLLFSETPKRRRRRSSSSVQIRGNGFDITYAAEKHLKRSTLILELLERRAEQLQNASSLIFPLFDTLEQLMALGTDSRLPVLYTEELLANCLILLVHGLKKQGGAPELGTLKVNIVVSCIRTSTSPQVQNRLLLLISALADLCPDAVLHGVMPIFTFMGANTVRLDNDYSAHVIEHTIEQVIPALIAAGDRHEEIETALLSFVAAFPHIPRHRRTRLFGKLVEVLGSEQSLYKLLLLLGQRYADSLDSRRVGDAKSLLQFATPFVRMFDAKVQVTAMCEYGLFVADSEESEDNENKSEYDSHSSNDDNDNSTDTSKLRFGLLKIRFALQKSSKLRNSFYEFLARTIAEPQVVSGTLPLRVAVAKIHMDWSQVGLLIQALLKYRDREPAAVLLLERILEALPISMFVASVEPLIQLEGYVNDSSSYERVLTLIGRKFEYEDKNNTTAIDCACRIINVLNNSLKEHSSSICIETAEQLSSHFGDNLKSSELALLDTLCGKAGLLSDDSDVVLASILAISTIFQQLGASTFPYFSRVFPVLCEKVRHSQALSANSLSSSTGDTEVDDGALDLAAFALFAGLLRQMPKFVAPEIPVILDLTFASSISLEPRQQLLSVIEDKIPSTTLLSALLSCWPAVSRGGLSSVNIFFALLDEVIAACPRTDLAAESSRFTQLLISCLSTREQSTDLNLVNQVEAKVVNSTVSYVMRLNDRVFRPQFVKVAEWGISSNVEARKISALKFVIKVLNQFKSLVTNYYGHILDPICDAVGSSETNPTVRKLAIDSLTASFMHDESNFWQSPTRFEQVTAALLFNIENDTVSNGMSIVKAVTALARASSTQNRKAINDDLAKLLAQPRSEPKIWSIKILSNLYKHLGDDWVSNLPQLVPIIAELLDDDDEVVELETRKSLVPVIESVLGESLDKYLA